MSDLISRQAAIDAVCDELDMIDHVPQWVYDRLENRLKQLSSAQPTADVRENIHSKKVIGGGEHDGATCWFECSSCHGSVDIEDAYCKHCGAVLEYEK